MTIGSIFRSTWALIKGNPGTIAVWSLLNLAIGIAMRWGMGPFNQAKAGNAVAIAQGLPPTFPPIARLLFLSILAGLAFVALYNAVFRAVLRPDERSIAYLRFGKDELRLLGLMLIFLVAEIGVAVLVVIIGVIFAMIFRGSVAAGPIGFGFGVALLGGGVFVGVRLCAVAPLTLYRRKIAIREGWSLTRGHFWRLFGAFAITMITVLVSIPLFLPTMGPMLHAISHPGDPAAQQQLAMIQAEQMANFWSPAMLAQTCISGLLGGIYLAIFGGMPAVATRQLLDERTGIAT